MRKLSRCRPALASENGRAITRFLNSSEAIEADNIIFEYEPDRPKRRSDCLPGGVNEQRPCPWATCPHHIAVLTTSSGGVREVEGWMEDGEPSCVLDVISERGSLKLEEIASLWGLTRERVRQIEFQGIRNLKVAGVDLAEYVEENRPRKMNGPRGVDGEPLYAIRRRRA